MNRRAKHKYDKLMDTFSTYQLEDVIHLVLRDRMVLHIKEACGEASSIQV